LPYPVELIVDFLYENQALGKCGVLLHVAGFADTLAEAAVVFADCQPQVIDESLISF